jgi:hypothetical protein
MNEKTLSVVIPREAVPAIMQKEGGRVGSKYFWEEGWWGPSPLFFEGRVTLRAHGRGVPAEGMVVDPLSYKWGCGGLAS